MSLEESYPADVTNAAQVLAEKGLSVVGIQERIQARFGTSTSEKWVKEQLRSARMFGKIGKRLDSQDLSREVASLKAVVQEMKSQPLELLDVNDSTTPFDRKIDAWPAHGAPVSMKDALVEVIDTLAIIKLGLESMGLTPAAYDLLETYDRVEAKRKELAK